MSSVKYCIIHFYRYFIPVRCFVFKVNSWITLKMRYDWQNYKFLCFFKHKLYTIKTYIS